MSEAGDYSPGPWRGYDFKSARKSYDRHVGRSYDDAKKVRKSKKSKDIWVPDLKTESESPLVIACDVTGSMGDWPATIFSKLPYLDLEGQEYLGKTMEISFAAVGDAYSDEYPLQVRPFTKGKQLENRLKELIIEGNGGGQIMESYDLCALYYARKVEMPRAIKPIFIMIGDEGCYDFVDKDQAKEYADVSLEKRLSTKDVMKELQSRYSVYLIRKPYDTGYGDGMSSNDKKIYTQWEKMLGADHISVLPEAGRVVDVIFGILAKETERVEYFEDELKGRQTEVQVNTVMTALNSIHTQAKTVRHAGHSVVKRTQSAKKSKSLL